MIKLVHYDKNTFEVLNFIDTSETLTLPVTGSLYSIEADVWQQYWGKPAWTNGRVITNQAPPDDYYQLTDNGWVADDDVKANVLKARQDEIWEKIKAKRDYCRHAGVKVGDKWFHTDESSRLQYLTLSGLPQLPPDLKWKTLDGTFVTMTKTILQQIIVTAMTAEQANFANAEVHRLQMLQADNPLDYDFSSGWSDVYVPQEAA